MTEEYPPIEGPIEDRRKPLKDLDAVERAYFLKAATWLVAPLLVFSVLVVFGSLAKGFSLLASLFFGIATGLGGAAFSYLVVYRGAIGGTAALFGRLYGVGSTGTPRPKTYWRAQALAVRGAHARALDSLELEALDDPGDPGPCLRAAALCAGELDDLEAAIEWYRRARGAKRIDAQTDAYVLTRLVELYETVGEGGRAIVELRRLINQHPESDYAEYARRRLERLRAERFAAHSSDGGEPAEGER